MFFITFHLFTLTQVSGSDCQNLWVSERFGDKDETFLKPMTSQDSVKGDRRKQFEDAYGTWPGGWSHVTFGADLISLGWAYIRYTRGLHYLPNEYKHDSMPFRISTPAQCVTKLITSHNKRFDEISKSLTNLKKRALGGAAPFTMYYAKQDSFLKRFPDMLASEGPQHGSDFLKSFFTNDIDQFISNIGTSDVISHFQLEPLKLDQNKKNELDTLKFEIKEPLQRYVACTREGRVEGRFIRERSQTRQPETPRCLVEFAAVAGAYSTLAGRANFFADEPLEAAIKAAKRKFGNSVVFEKYANPEAGETRVCRAAFFKPSASVAKFLRNLNKSQSTRLGMTLNHFGRSRDLPSFTKQRESEIVTAIQGLKDVEHLADYLFPVRADLSACRKSTWPVMDQYLRVRDLVESGTREKTLSERVSHGLKKQRNNILTAGVVAAGLYGLSKVSEKESEVSSMPRKRLFPRRIRIVAEESDDSLLWIVSGLLVALLLIGVALQLSTRQQVQRYTYL